MIFKIPNSGGKWDMASEGFIQEQIKRGRIKNKEELKEKIKFRETYSERIFSTFAQGKIVPII